MGVVVERNDPQYALGITHEHSLVAQRYMQRENIEVTFSTEHTKGKFSKSDQFTVSTFTHFTSCIGLLRQDWDDVRQLGCRVPLFATCRFPQGRKRECARNFCRLRQAIKTKTKSFPTSPRIATGRTTLMWSRVAKASCKVSVPIYWPSWSSLLERAKRASWPVEAWWVLPVFGNFK